MSENISLSFELVCLVNWLLKNEKTMMTGLVKQAIDNGFVQELEQLDSEDYEKVAEHLYTSLLDFILCLEKNLLKGIDSMKSEHHVEGALIPTIKKLDAHNIEVKSLWLSIQQAKSKLARSEHFKKPCAPPGEHIYQEDAATVLFERILKNWKPTLKEPVN